MKYLYCSIISVIIIVAAYLYFSNWTDRPYEESDDPAWAFEMNGVKAQILAERKGSENVEFREALVLWEDGNRSWVKVTKLPHYYKLRVVDTKQQALVSDDHIEELIVGLTLEEIESSLAYATEIKGNDVVFPIKVLKKDADVSADSVIVTFKDSVAESVHYTLEPDEDAYMYSLLPGMFTFIDKGIRAPQRDGYASFQKNDGNQKKKEYEFGDFTVKVVGFLLKLLFFLIVLVAAAFSPVLVASPLLELYEEYFTPKPIGILLGLATIVAFLWVFCVISLIFNGASLVVPIIAICVNVIFALMFCRRIMKQ